MTDLESSADQSYVPHKTKDEDDKSVWFYFLIGEKSAKGSAKCKRCGQILKTKGGSTKGLHTHLKTHNISVLLGWHKDTPAENTKTTKRAVSKRLKQSPPAEDRKERVREEEINHIEEPFEFIGDLKNSYLTEPDEAFTNTSAASIKNISEILETPLSAFPKIVIQNEPSRSTLQYQPFYEYLDTLLKKLPENVVQGLSKHILDVVHAAIENQSKL